MNNKLFLENQYEILYKDSNKVLEFIALEYNIDTILNKIAKIVEERFPKNKCSILTYKKETNQLFTACAPSLPRFYNDAVNGIKAGDKVGSCGTAVYKKERVIVKDIDTHENWKNFLELTKKANLHSCWSEPIISKNDEILGSFALYSHEIKEPTSFELKQINNFAYLIAIAMTKDSNNKELIKKELIRKELEISLKEKNEELNIFKQVIENINSGVVISSSDKEQSIIYVNKAFEEKTGYSKEEVLGSNCRILQSKDRDQKGVQLVKEALSKNESCQVELKNYKKNGELFYNLLNLSPIFTPEGEVKYYVGVQNDITELKHHERMILEQSKMSAMGEMIGNIAHQWRQPLSIITTAASGIILQKEHNLLTDEMLEEYLENIGINAQYLSKTIDTFRNFIQEKKVLERVILQDRIDKSLQITSSSLKNNYIKIINNVDYSSPIKITLVAGELIQVIINILNNAKDILSERDIENRWIKVDLEQKDNKAMITIEDNAGGIPEEIIGKIFTAYFTTKHKSQGTGLGLFISHKIVSDSLNGRIYVKNTQNGAKFYIELPLDE